MADSLLTGFIQPDLSFITATANDIATGKISVNNKGQKIIGNLNPTATIHTHTFNKRAADGSFIETLTLDKPLLAILYIKAVNKSGTTYFVYPPIIDFKNKLYINFPTYSGGYIYGTPKAFSSTDSISLGPCIGTINSGNLWVTAPHDNIIISGQFSDDLLSIDFSLNAVDSKQTMYLEPGYNTLYYITE